jgi:hypothetical protein
LQNFRMDWKIILNVLGYYALMSSWNVIVSFHVDLCLVLNYSACIGSVCASSMGTIVPVESQRECRLFFPAWSHICSTLPPGHKLYVGLLCSYPPHWDTLHAAPLPHSVLSRAHL